MGTAAWQLCLWGAPLLSAEHHRPISLARKDAAWLAYAALEPYASSATLAAMLWSGVDTRAELNNLRQRVHRLRRATSARLVEMSTALVLAPDLELAAPPGRSDLEAAPVELLGHDTYLDAPLFAAWLAIHRQRARDSRRDLLASLASDAEREGKLARALVLAHRLASEDPVSEHAARRLMRLQYLRGDRAAAVAAFEACEQRLRDDLGVRPGAETVALLQTIEQATPPTRPPPMSAALVQPPRTVGRDGVARDLAQAYADGALPVVVGEAGIGKTRLLQDFIGTRPQAVYVRARPSDAGVPYGMLARVVRVLTARANDAPDAASVAAWQLPSTPAQTVDALAGLIAQNAAHGVDVLVVDDLHYADRASVEVLRALLDEPRAGAVRWVFAHRPQPASGDDAGLLDALSEAPQVRWLLLAPLTQADVTDLLESLGQHEPARIEWLAEALVRHSGGNPLYIIETLRAMHAAGPEATTTLPRPASIEHLLDMRLRRLSASALALARVAAIAGADFSIMLAEQALSKPALALADAWAELEGADLLRGEAFAHDLVCDAVLRATPAAVARRAHEQVAAYCEREGAEPARIAAHWYAAGRGKEAAAAYRAAADRAHMSGRTREYCELLEAAAQSHAMAGDHDAALQARLDINAQLVHTRGPAAGLAHIEVLLGQTSTPQQRALALLAQAHALHWSARAADAECSARSALALGDGVEPATRIALTRMLAHALVFQDRDLEGVRMLRDVEAAAAVLPSPSDQADFLGDLAVLLINVDQPMEALPVALRHLDLVRREGNAVRLAFSLGTLFGLHSRRGALTQALVCAQEAHAALNIGGRQAAALAGHSQTNLGAALCALARYSEGLAALREAATMLAGGINPGVLEMNLNRQVECLIVLGQTARAQALLARGDTEIPKHQRLARCFARALLARAMGGDERPWWEQALTFPSKRHGLRIRAAAEMQRFEPEVTLALKRAAALQQQATELGYLPLALRIASIRIERAAAAGLLREIEHLAPWIESQDPQIGAAIDYPPQIWSSCAAGYEAIGRWRDGTRCRELAWRWVCESALPQVPPEYRDSFLERNTTNRALRAWAAREFG